MLLQIVSRTPVGVWLLLAGLIAFGLQQARARSVGLTRATVVPVVLVGLSLAGVVSAFGAAPVAFVAWAAGIAASLILAGRWVAPRGAVWVAPRRQLEVPGSWLPMALILGLFVTKYAAGVSLALQPGLAADRTFEAVCGLAFGAFSGLFAARAAALWRLAR